MCKSIKAHQGKDYVRVDIEVTDNLARKIISKGLEKAARSDIYRVWWPT